MHIHPIEFLASETETMVNSPGDKMQDILKVP